MTNHEAIEFENQLQKDPLLENEFQLQKDIVNSVRNFRQAELKASLNAVDVGVGGTFTVLKVAAGIAAIALLGFVAYYYTGNPDNAQPELVEEETIPVMVEEGKPVETIAETETNVEVTQTSEQIDNVTDTEEKTELKDELKAGDPATQETKVSATREIVESSQETSKPEQPAIKLPEVVEEFDREEGQISENIKVPENKLSQVTETYLPKTEVVEMDHRKYSFHYQFYNNKLYLYGEFDNKYEILELNTPSGISIYMFYKDNFYELEQNQEKITPLNAIENSTLMRDLKTIREN